MKNLDNHYTISTFDFLNKIISSKKNSPKDQNYTQRLAVIVPILAQFYTSYDNCYHRNELHQVLRFIPTKQQKDDFLKLYNYKSKLLVDYRLSITSINSNIYQSTCQYCTINSVNSLDHFLPKDDNSAFVVHPYNLIPSCTECNSFKLSQWYDTVNQHHIFLNLYKDILPAEKYLFVNILVNSLDDININFELKNISGIDTHIFNIILSHYTRLNLFFRFKQNCSDTIIELTNSVKAYLAQGVSMDQIVRATLVTCMQDKKHKGENHYLIILKEALILSDDYQKLF